MPGCDLMLCLQGLGGCECLHFQMFERLWVWHQLEDPWTCECFHIRGVELNRNYYWYCNSFLCKYLQQNPWKLTKRLELQTQPMMIPIINMCSEYWHKYQWLWATCTYYRFISSQKLSDTYFICDKKQWWRPVLFMQEMFTVCKYLFYLLYTLSFIHW